MGDRLGRFHASARILAERPIRKGGYMLDDQKDVGGPEPLRKGGPDVLGASKSHVVKIDQGLFGSRAVQLR